MDNLFLRAQSGDKKALGELCVAHGALVRSVAKRFAGRGEEFEDLVQIGSIGLCKAVMKFDTGLGYKFSTYAVWLISGEIRRHLRDTSSIKVSRALKETAHKASVAASALRDELGREPNISEIAERCGIEREDIIMAMDAAREPQSLYEKVGEDTELMEIIPADSTEGDKIERIALSEALKKATSQERRLIALRYFEDKTQSETARVLGISQVQVSRLEKKALAKIKMRME
ncbi:MAG: sigma-70 family RNA polymerase sigma factor [Clostridia bacterium]|nr:sigma-70 family RNA polymerase sigma factor [Clostridia bacterium]